jgi:hypothetical protein
MDNLNYNLIKGKLDINSPINPTNEYGYSRLKHPQMHDG